MPKILICNATAPEFNACAASFKGSKSVFVIKTGMGTESARAALKKEIQAHGKPDLVVSSGYAGAWTSGLPLYSWAFSEKPCFWAENHTEAEQFMDFSNSSDQNHPLIEKLKDELKKPPFYNVTSITTEYVYPEPRKSATISGEICVDMESHSLAEVCHEDKIPFFVLRMISDTADVPLPPFISAWTKTFVTESASGKISEGIKSFKQTFSGLPGLTTFLINGKKLQREYEEAWQKLESTLFAQFRS